MDLLQLANADLRVDLRGSQVRMAKHGLDVSNVCAVLEHQRCHRVAEHVARTLLADLGGLNVAPDVFG